MKHLSFPVIPCLLAAMVLSVPAAAADAELCWGDVYCFSSSDLTDRSDALGVLVTDVPQEDLGTVYLGARPIVAGDVLTISQAQQLTLVPVSGAAGEAEISCLSITPDGLEPESRMTIRIGSGKNEAPTAMDSAFETYKNIPGTVPLEISDPEDDPMTVQIVKEPKRGTLEIGEDGSVSYTPMENKVGKDSFTYTVTDAAGNTSEEATVRIRIKKPAQETYRDMDGDPAQLAAAWLQESGIYQGKTVAGAPLFCPDETVSRGEFIAMCVTLTGQEPQRLETGFIDSDDTALWLQPYVSTALQCGYLGGIPTENGLALEADAPMTKAQAAIMLADLLNLPETDAQVVSALDADVPVWAASALGAVETAGFQELSGQDGALSRRDAALLLYRCHQLSGEDQSLLSWAKEQ